MSRAIQLAAWGKRQSTNYFPSSSPLKGPQNELMLVLPGVSGNYASTPDTTANSITGDIDLRVRVTMTDYTPASIQAFIAKDTEGAGGRSYAFFMNTDGTLGLIWSEDGTALKTKASTSATSVTDGATKWLRAVLDVDNGAVGNDVFFYTSNDGVTWTQLGTTVTTAATTSIFNSTSVDEVGSSATGTNKLFIGQIRRAMILNGIAGTIVNDFNPNNAVAGATTVNGLTGEVWTINTSGATKAQILNS